MKARSGDYSMNKKKLSEKQKSDTNIHVWVQTIFTILTFLFVGIGVGFGSIYIANEQKEISERQLEISSQQIAISERQLQIANQQNQISMTASEPIIIASRDSGVSEKGEISYTFSNIGGYAKSVAYPDYVYCIHLFNSENSYVYIPIKISNYSTFSRSDNIDSIYSIVGARLENHEDALDKIKTDAAKFLARDSSTITVAYTGAFVKIQCTSIFDITKDAYFYIENDDIDHYLNTSNAETMFSQDAFSIDNYDVDELNNYINQHSQMY